MPGARRCFLSARRKSRPLDHRQGCRETPCLYREAASPSLWSPGEAEDTGPRLLRYAPNDNLRRPDPSRHSEKRSAEAISFHNANKSLPKLTATVTLLT